MSDDSFPIFQDLRESCCERIKSVRSSLKMVLITKDDPFLLDRWITHHIKIVGSAGLIIFDNMSEDPEVLSIYRRYRGQIEIMRFAGKYMRIHHAGTYCDLYRAIAESSDYSIFLDTDEYLVLIESDRYYDDGRVLKFVMDNASSGLFPTTWLLNANWSDAQFDGIEDAGLAVRLALGKPLVRSDILPTGYVNHNFQLASQLFAPPFKANLFLVHLSKFLPRQRVIANINKLVTLGAVRPGETAESIAQRNDIRDEVAALYVREIRECLHFDRNQNAARAVLGPGGLELSPDGTVRYYGEAERRALNEFLRDPRPVYNSIPDHYRRASILDGRGPVMSLSY